MLNRTKMLKVKIKSLAVEAQIIRREERKARDHQTREELHSHRVNDVRHEARCSLLAYAFLRGKSKVSVEPCSKCAPDWKRVGQIVRKFGTTEFLPAQDAQHTAFLVWTQQ